MVSLFEIKRNYLKKQAEKEKKRRAVEEARLRRIAEEERQLSKIRADIERSKQRSLTPAERKLLAERKKRIEVKKAKAKANIKAVGKVLGRIADQADSFLAVEKPKKKKTTTRKKVAKRKSKPKQTKRKPPKKRSGGGKVSKVEVGREIIEFGSSFF